MRRKEGYCHEYAYKRKQKKKYKVQYLLLKSSEFDPENSFQKFLL